MRFTANGVVLKKVIRWATLAAIIYLVTVIVFYIFQRSLIYYPQARIILSNELNLKLPIQEGNVLVSIREKSSDKALIYFGGNAEDVALNLHDFSTAFPEHALYLMHYRSYGGSSGKPSEAALMKDALALYNTVYKQHTKIIIIGRSLGSGIAVQLANARAATHVVLVTPYNSLQELAQNRFPYFPVAWMLHDKYESWRYAPNIHIPVLLLAAENDLLVPRNSTELLYSHFKQHTTQFKILPKTTHNTISESPHYLLSIKAFCK